MLAGMLAQVLAPIQVGTVGEITAQVELNLALARLSPNTLFVEATMGLLDPTTRSFGLILPTQLQGALLGSPLPLGESILLIWPQLTALIAVTLLLFTAAYVHFQRQEIRA